MNPLSRFRDWWFAPVVSRLDVLIAATGTSPLNRHSVVSEVNAASDRVQTQWSARIEPDDQPSDMNAMARSVASAIRSLRAPQLHGDPTEPYRRAGYSREEC